MAFYRSAALWFFPWIVLAVVAIGALWIAIDALGNDAGADSEPPKETKAAAAAETSPTSEKTGPSESEASTESDAKPHSKKDKSNTPKLITDDVVVQVLDGTKESSIGDHWASKLEELGFEVEVVNPYLPATETVVYWSSSEFRAAAEALAAHFDWGAEPKPNELSDAVSIHVYLGEDEA